MYPSSKAVLVLFGGLLAFGHLQAQEKKQPVRFQSALSVGMVIGESKIGLVSQIYGGVEKGRIGAGIGAGYDGYRFRGFPIFAGIHYVIGPERKIFTYAQAGYHLPEKRIDTSNNWQTKEYRGGFYMNAGMGVRIPLGGVHRLAFSTGFSLKYQRNTTTFHYRGACATCDPTVQRQFHRLGRIISTLSWQIGK